MGVVKEAIKLIEKSPHPNAAVRLIQRSKGRKQRSRKRSRGRSTKLAKRVKDLERKLKTKTIELAKMQVAAESFKKKSRRAIRKLTRRRRAIRNLQSSRRPAQCRVQKKCVSLVSFDIGHMDLGVHWASIGASKRSDRPSKLRLPPGFITWLKKQKSVVDHATI